MAKPAFEFTICMTAEPGKIAVKRITPTADDPIRQGVVVALQAGDRNLARGDGRAAQDAGA